MRKRLRERVAIELARAERLIRAWTTPESYDVYMGRDEYGLPRRLNPSPPPPIHRQLMTFVERVVLRREMKLNFKIRVKPEDAVRVAVSRSNGSNGVYVGRSSL